MLTTAAAAEMSTACLRSLHKYFIFPNSFHSNDTKPSAAEENQENISNDTLYQLRLKQEPTKNKLMLSH